MRKFLNDELSAAEIAQDQKCKDYYSRLLGEDYENRFAQYAGTQNAGED